MSELDLITAYRAQLKRTHGSALAVVQSADETTLLRLAAIGLQYQATTQAAQKRRPAGSGS